MAGIDKAVRAVGGQSELARLLGIKPQSVQQWVHQGYVPPGRCPAVRDLTGVKMHDLNPHVFPKGDAA